MENGFFYQQLITNNDEDYKYKTIIDTPKQYIMDKLNQAKVDKKLTQLKIATFMNTNIDGTLKEKGKTDDGYICKLLKDKNIDYTIDTLLNLLDALDLEVVIVPNK